MDKIFLRAFLVSLVGHLLFFFPWQGFKNKQSPKYFPEVEVNYFEIKPKLEEVKIVKTGTKEEKKVEEEIKEERKIEVEQELKEEKKETELVNKKKNVSSPITPEEEWVGRDFKALSKEPVFLDYYRAIREKIKISAQRNKPLFFKAGEICIFFILDSKGNLRRLKIIEAKSSHDPLLREIALRSVEEASPFPPFPQELKREQIAFNIIIAFEVR
ncbi:MAG: energy transducer TonB [Candidatus Omnitrophica bacterium]|nr:energy transducer TonB [Candidatus Omnitrophota bacterium]